MADWFGDSGFNFDFPSYTPNFDFGFDPSWQNFDFSSMFPMPDFNFDFGNFGGYDPSMFSFTDPLALPSFDQNFSSQFNPSQGLDFSGLFSPQTQAPMQLADLGFGNTNTPQTALPSAGLSQGSDPLLNLQGSDQGQGLGYDPAMGGDLTSMFGGSALPGGSDYQSPLPGLGGAPYAPGAQPATPGGAMGQLPGLGAGYNAQGQPMSEFEKFMAAQTAKQGQPASTMDTIAKLAAAFGPTVLGGVGLGLQQANRPQRNPLEDQLLQARIASTGQQDALAKDRLDFEKSNAEASRQAQMEMQNALLESRRPGGQGNIDALLKGNPQLAALYQALTKQSTDLAGGGSPEFNALLQQIASVDISELERQAQQQMAQAQETAARTGVNPANIIAEINQRLLQEKAKALANARSTLIQMMGPGANLFNSIGGIFGNLFQTPAAG